MPWHWTDDLARTLIDSGRVERSVLSAWLTSPVAIRSPESDAETVATTLLDAEAEEDIPARPMAA